MGCSSSHDQPINTAGTEPYCVNKSTLHHTPPPTEHVQQDIPEMTREDFTEDIWLKITSLHEKKGKIKSDINEFKCKARVAAEEKKVEVVKRYVNFVVVLGHQLKYLDEAEHRLDEIRVNAQILDVSSLMAEVMAGAVKNADKLNLEKAQGAQHNLMSIKHLMGDMQLDIEVVTRLRNDVLTDIDVISAPSTRSDKPQRDSVRQENLSSREADDLLKEVFQSVVRELQNTIGDGEDALRNDEEQNRKRYNEELRQMVLNNRSDVNENKAPQSK